MKVKVTSGYGSSQQKYLMTFLFAGTETRCHSALGMYFPRSAAEMDHAEKKELNKELDILEKNMIEKAARIIKLQSGGGKKVYKFTII